MHASSYNHGSIEKKWQDYWEKNQVFRVFENAEQKKQYCLGMFPYPSNDGLHVGHPEGYTATDIYARYLRMNGTAVLHPMGWDAFGLPAENYAIKKGIHPAIITEKNINNFRRQIKSLGFSYDWTREINTSSPEYYKWTQWLFLELYKQGLAYKKKAPVNWCASCQTVLANEQVAEGACERCKSTVTQKELEQWFFAVTNYAENLLRDLDSLDWPESIKRAQRNWIGKSEGSLLQFPIISEREQKNNYVLLHGFEGSPDGIFFPWLEKELDKRGLTYATPQLPRPDKPREQEQVDSVLKRCTFDKHTILFGHSLGAVVALKVAERLPSPIAGLVIAGGFMDTHFRDMPRPFTDTFSWKFDFEKIKHAAKKIIILSSTDDYAIPIEQGRKLHAALGGTLLEAKGESPHFINEREPIILECLIPTISVFTTRADTLYGATYIVLTPEHPLLENKELEITNWQEIEEYRIAAKRKTELERLHLEKEKTGVELKGIKAINPATGEKIPVWVADYVVATYGTGAIMAVPAHDSRDFAFAKKYQLPIKRVILPHEHNVISTQHLGIPEVLGRNLAGFSELTPRHLERQREIPSVHNDTTLSESYEGEGILVDSETFSGMDSQTAKKAITDFVGGVTKVQYKLRDWLISRQRYWGTPIPIIYCDRCGEVPVPEIDLPVLLPTDVDFRPTGESPLTRSRSFHDVKCPTCDMQARRESDTMDTFVCSSWYFLRYACPQNTDLPFTKESVDYWLPVDMYVGGAEHAVLHLLYARFVTKALQNLGYLAFGEPFTRLRNQGLILGQDGEKMSKSRGNVINPDEIIERYGADTLRIYEMFMGPFEDAKPWSEKNIIGVRRFLEKVWRIYQGAGYRVKGIKKEEKIAKSDLQKELHKTIKKVTDDIVTFKFNTAISAMMVCANRFNSALTQGESIPLPFMEKFVLLLSPFAPHLAEELWQNLGKTDSLAFHQWPMYDPTFLREEIVRLIIQINGKVRDSVDVSADASADVLQAIALARPAIQKWTQGKQIKKIITVPKRLINIVF